VTVKTVKQKVKCYFQIKVICSFLDQ